MNSTSSQPNFFFYAIVILKKSIRRKESDEKSFISGKPSSGGEQAKEFGAISDRQKAGIGVLMKWSSCIQKSRGCKKLLLAKRLRKGIIIVCLPQRAEMEQSTKESVESLNKQTSGQIRIFPLGTVNDLARH